MPTQPDPQPLFRISKSTVNGQGMFAKTAIPAGTLIGQEDPLLVFDTRIGFQA
ncbi:hypothetical protein BDV96DRAFT_579294 [Lophiotrema nucula]|uniref:SET domain-containing protein n=1 Tax=Lophiotrema nucula TaxID=690887 RepID=A0A6A5Z0E7_9PLEO|nr:hypothetical protein BDV96DRAFT_579294 [Lophiotrema nucula]